ncbi:hypothetical protein [Paenibacillus sp. sgz302251]
MTIRTEKRPFLSLIITLVLAGGVPITAASIAHRKAQAAAARIADR